MDLSNKINESKILALIYLNHQDLSGKNPEDLWSLYEESYKKINEESKKSAKDKKQFIFPSDGSNENSNAIQGIFDGYLVVFSLFNFHRCHILAFEMVEILDFTEEFNLPVSCTAYLTYLTY